MNVREDWPWLAMVVGGAWLLSGGTGGPFTPAAPPPIALPGFNVLVIEETEDRPRLPAGKVAALQSTAIPSYVQSRGGTYLELDDDPSKTLLDQAWQEACARPRTELPWLVVSNGKTGFEGPLPATEEAALELLKRYGGD